MKVLDRWKGRRRSRIALTRTAKQEHESAQRRLAIARAKNKPGRGQLVRARDAAAKKLAGRRRQVIRASRVIDRHTPANPSGAAQALTFARNQVGRANESPSGSNWSPKIGPWIRASGYVNPVPWCQCFANAVAVAGGCPQLKTGYTPTVLAGIGGYRPVPAAKAQAADFCYFKWPRISSAPCDHVGVLVSMTKLTVTCAEGNTSPGTAGSQNDGGGVFLRTRPRDALVAGFVHPPYAS